MDENLRIVLLGIIGGFLGWSMGKVLDRYGSLQYVIIAALCLGLVLLLSIR